VSGPGRNQTNNGFSPAHLNAVATNHSTGLHKVTSIDELKDLVAKTYNVFKERFTEEAHEHPSYQAYRSVYAVFKHDPSRLNLSIPGPLWMKLDENIKKQIVCIQQEIRESKESKEKSTEKTIIGKQYPSLAKPEQDVRQAMTALSYIRECVVSDLFDNDDSLVDIDINDDDIFEHIRHVKMVSVHGEFWDENDTIDIQANFRVAYKCVQGGKFYAISDGGADSCILGSSAHMINLTERFARLVGYDLDTTQSARVPIASGYIKTKFNGNFVLLLINEAPYLAHSPTTLLSEHQIREYGKVIDSCAETHVVSSNPRLIGKQRLEISAESHIPMEDRGAIMGIPIFQYEEDDDTQYPIHEIASNSTWVPYRYRHHQISADT
jgi:hypothetical protein